MSNRSAVPPEPGRDYLTSLPVELKAFVFKDLNLLDKLSLRFTNKYFSNYIPAYTHADYLQAEQIEPAKGTFFACYICCRLRPRGKFADNARVQGKGPGARKAIGRYCLDCGLRENANGYAKLPRNSWVTIDKEPWIVCFQCGNLGKAHKGDGTLFCEDCWRLDVQPRLEAHANPVPPDPVKVREQRRIGETWVSNYRTPHDVVQSAIRAGLSAPNAFAKHKKWDSNGEEVVLKGDFHASDKDLTFDTTPAWVHPKLVKGKSSKHRYRQRYRKPIMTRSVARNNGVVTGLINAISPSAKATNSTGGGVAMDLDTPAAITELRKGDSAAIPGPSTLANPVKEANISAEADSVLEDKSVPVSAPLQNGTPAGASSTAGTLATPAGPSKRPSPKDPTSVPIWAQKARTPAGPSQRPNRKAHEYVHGGVKKTTAQAGPYQSLDPKAPEYVPTQAEKATRSSAAAGNTKGSKPMHVFAQPRYNIHMDMDMKPPCALKIDLKARSYSTKPAPPACDARGNSGNIIGMNYIKARRSLYQMDPNRKLGWHTVWTANPTSAAELNDLRAKAFATMQAHTDNPKKRKARDSSPQLIPAHGDSPYVDKRQKKRRIDEDSDEEWKGFSDRSKSSSPECAGGSTLEELRAKALARRDSVNTKKRKVCAAPDAAGSKSAWAHFHNPLVENFSKKPRLDEDTDDSFKGLSDSDSSWKGFEG